MSLPTCAVRARVYKQDGTPDEGAFVIATLTRFDIDEGHVGPYETIVTADVDGVAILNLWPNARGATESTYRVRIEGSDKTLTVTAVVPDVASIDLEDITTLPPYEGMAEGAAAIALVVEQMAQLADDVAAADADAATATAQATLATTAANSAEADAASAAIQAGIAITKASEAAVSASTASTGATTATTQAGITTTKAAEALASANAADVSEAAALASQIAAALSESNAQDSATAAEDSAVIADTSADTATAQAVISTSSATAAAASEAMALAARPTTSASPPSAPLPNTEWIDSATGRHYTWLQDTDGYQWVETFSASVVDNPALVEILEAQLAASDGGALVGFSHASTYPPGSLGAKAKFAIYANDAPFNAAGNGVTNDKAAVEAAVAALPAVGGIVYLRAGTYYSPTGFQFARNNVTFRGEGMPRVADDLNSLVGGTILQGTVLFDGHNLTLEDFGADHGITYSNTYKGGVGGDGLVIHPVTPGDIKRNNNIRNVCGLTRIGDSNDAQAAFHAVLIEGLRGGSATNVTGVGGWFGVVAKVADFNLDKLTGRENDAVSVQIKSNSYAPVDRVNIGSVICSNYVARGYVGFLVVASNAVLQTVNVNNVTVQGGINCVRILAEGTEPCVAVSLGNVVTRGGTSGISAQGPIYGLVVGTATIYEPSGVGFFTEANTVAAHPVDVTVNNLRVVPSSTSTGAVDIGSPNTRAVFGTVNAAGAGGSLTAGSIINVQATTDIGQYFGTLKANGVVPTLVNGWASAFGQPTGLIVKSGWTRGYGRLSAAAATSDVFMSIPAGMRPSNLEFYTSMTAFDGATSKHVVVTVLIALNGDASIFPNRAAYSGISAWNLTDLFFATSIPVEGGI